MNIFTKLALMSLIGIIGVGSVGISPARAQEANVDGALIELRAARTAFQADRNNVDVRKSHLHRTLDVLKVRGDVHRHLDTNVRKVVDADGRDLDTLRARVANASTVAELRAVATEIRTHRKSDKVRMAVLESFIEKLNTAIDVAEQRSSRLGDILANLANENREVGPLQDLLNQANREIDAAVQALAEVTETIRTSGEDLNLGQTKKDLKEVSSLLKEVYRIFKEVVKGAQAL